ncbi:unnamed protein product [Adineta steineri]|uniref:G-protein coupled receptors family 1 profile domain-containing protein n=1 Tax=Adineta steineri TaxID=433720 RepID=A0A815M402_9BILA|nr:unnamed protein product [Adineta steineri]
MYNATTINIESWFVLLDILAIICIIFVIILSIIYLFIIILDKTCHTIPLMLIGNTCFIAFLAGCSILSMCIFTLENDLKQIHYQDSLCIFRAYTAYVSCALFNFSFLLQAIYRYITVIYPSYLLWQSAKIQILFICLIWIFSFTYPFEFVFTNEITYNIDNQICQLPFQFSLSIIYVTHCAYIIPVLMIMLIYFKLVRYVREMGKRVTPVNTLFRAQRELKMVQRTVIIITILVILCFPYALFIGISFFTAPPKYHFRIAYIFADVSILSVMVALFQFTDSLKDSIMKRINRTSNIIVIPRT